jgi:NADP-dependent 3-hydroxy acid dehydrogenase YdfG
MSTPPYGIVTGAGSGMGQAITWALAHEGYDVLAIGRTLDKLQTTATQAPEPGRVVPIAVDVADRAAVTSTIQHNLKDRGAPAVVVNNAGINIRQRACDSLSPEDFDRVLATNLAGVYNVVHAVLPAMKQAEGGLFVTISSVAALRPLPLAGAAYSASKHAVNGFMGTVAREMAAFGIRCTLICPGEVATPILDQRPVPVTADQRAAMLQASDIADAFLFVLRLPPRAHVTEIVIKPLVQDYG